jgi:hypothetical protein
MPKPFTLDPAFNLDELAACHQDIEHSLRLYFSPASPTFTARFAGEPPDDVSRRLAVRLKEADNWSSFAALTSLEARFRIDFDVRCRKRLKDPLSLYFREVKSARERVRLDEDILEGWKRHTDASTKDISALRGAFNFRNWFAHGRYYPPKFGRKYDFDYVYLMADTIISGFPFLLRL